MVLSIQSSSRQERYTYQIHPSLYGGTSWFIYKIDIEGSYITIGPYMNKEEAETDMRNLIRENEEN
jgi:hypothetical protein|tara:strand:- start:2572 stop:2769 length:198 start_codon:yes stop_codon:yes gene_type:complete